VAPFQDPQTLYYVLELCPNGDLASHLKRVGRFPEKVVQFYAAEIVGALEHMHLKGIIHRDVKPDNVLLDKNFHAKLTDFGTSKCGFTGENQRARADSFCGTEEFVSPELLLLEDPYSAKSSDIWALGCVLYQLMSGKCPFKGETGYQTFELIKKREFQFPSHFSPEARDLIDNLLVVDPEQRLGVGEGGYAKLKAHSFFNGIDFATVHQQTPPKIVSATDC